MANINSSSSSTHQTKCHHYQKDRKESSGSGNPCLPTALECLCVPPPNTSGGRKTQFALKCAESASKRLQQDTRSCVCCHRRLDKHDHHRGCCRSQKWKKRRKKSRIKYFPSILSLNPSCTSQNKHLTTSSSTNYSWQ